MYSNTDNILTSEYMESEHIPLTELQTKVILTLAERGPLTGYDFHLGGKRTRGNRKAMMSSSSWEDDIKAKLGPNGMNLIEKADLRGTSSFDGRGRRRDPYWLSDMGVIVALMYDAKTKLLMENLKIVVPDKRYLQLITDFKEALGQEGFTFAFYKTKELGFESLSENVLGPFIVQGLIYAMLRARELSPTSNPLELKERLKSIISKYPEFEYVHRKVVEVARREVNDLLSNW